MTCGAPNGQAGETWTVEEADNGVTDDLIEEIENDDGTRCIRIVRRWVGLYSYVQVSYDLPEIAGLPGPYCGVYDSAETAEREARARVPWLSQTSN